MWSALRPKPGQGAFAQHQMQKHAKSAALPSQQQVGATQGWAGQNPAGQQAMPAAGGQSMRPLPFAAGGDFSADAPQPQRLIRQGQPAGDSGWQPPPPPRFAPPPPPSRDPRQLPQRGGGGTPWISPELRPFVDDVQQANPNMHQAHAVEKARQAQNAARADQERRQIQAKSDSRDAANQKWMNEQQAMSDRLAGSGGVAPGQAQSQQSPWATSTPYGQQLPFGGLNYGIPPFEFRATDFMGNQFSDPAAFTAQQGAMTQALNQQRAQGIGQGQFGSLNPQLAYQQGAGMLQGGWQNPFAAQEPAAWTGQLATIPEQHEWRSFTPPQQDRGAAIRNLLQDYNIPQNVMDQIAGMFGGQQGGQPPATGGDRAVGVDSAAEMPAAGDGGQGEQPQANQQQGSQPGQAQPIQDARDTSTPYADHRAAYEERLRQREVQQLRDSLGQSLGMSGANDSQLRNALLQRVDQGLPETASALDQAAMAGVLTSDEASRLKSELETANFDSFYQKRAADIHRGGMNDKQFADLRSKAAQDRWNKEYGLRGVMPKREQYADFLVNERGVSAAEARRLAEEQYEARGYGDELAKWESLANRTPESAPTQQQLDAAERVRQLRGLPTGEEVVKRKRALDDYYAQLHQRRVAANQPKPPTAKEKYEQALNAEAAAGRYYATKPLPPKLRKLYDAYVAEEWAKRGR